MRRSIVVAVLVLLVYVVVRLAHAPQIATAPTGSGNVAAAPSTVPAAPPETSTPGVSDNGSIARAFANRARDVRVDGEAWCRAYYPTTIRAIDINDFSCGFRQANPF